MRGQRRDGGSLMPDRRFVALRPPALPLALAAPATPAPARATAPFLDNQPDTAWLAE